MWTRPGPGQMLPRFERKGRMLSSCRYVSLTCDDHDASLLSCFPLIRLLLLAVAWRAAAPALYVDNSAWSAHASREASTPLRTLTALTQQRGCCPLGPLGSAPGPCGTPDYLPIEPFTYTAYWTSSPSLVFTALEFPGCFWTVCFTHRDRIPCGGC